MASKEQRRRQLARQKYERQQQRRAAQRRTARRRNVTLAAGLAVVLAAGAAAYASVGLSGGDTQDDAAPRQTPRPTPTHRAPDPCAKPAPGAVKRLHWAKEPALTIDRSASYTMTLRTTCGTVTVALDAAAAPHTVNSFNFLAGQGYFDHTRCHRLTSGGLSVLQCGDPKGTGAGGPGYTIPDENLKDPKLKGNVYPAGTVAMANQYDPQTGKGRDSGGSQFFLVYRDSQLPPDYTPFGTITGGMSVLKKIAKAGAAPPDATRNTAPNATVVIDKATVRKS